ncbi:MAG: MBL fold metallo-hydrolase [Gammaproteobacteria bacterium]|nr:MBL fold metallo-hydrolase [Gammaproteobacteria bacterium]
MPGPARVHRRAHLRLWPHGAGRHAEAVADGDEVKIEESADTDFRPDHEVCYRHRSRRWLVADVFTPGHTSNHMCYQLREEKALFTGDHVMAWSTSAISPPDGDMEDYMASLELLLERDDDIYWPTHGPAVREPHEHVRAFIAHRREREQQILDCVDAGIERIDEMVPRMYAGLPEFMYPVRARCRGRDRSGPAGRARRRRSARLRRTLRGRWNAAARAWRRAGITSASNQGRWLDPAPVAR